MNYVGKLKLKSHNTSYCLIQVATEAGLQAPVIYWNRIKDKFLTDNENF
jgi:hypothetical protein